jgi:hypothetical protein
MRKFLKPVFTGLAFLLFAWQLEAAAGAPWAVILHWNDMHSANLPYQPGKADYLVGGYANLAGYIDSLRNLYPHAIVLNAGDDFQGSPVSNLTRGLSQILILNKIRPSALRSEIMSSITASRTSGKPWRWPIFRCCHPIFTTLRKMTCWSNLI